MQKEATEAELLAKQSRSNTTNAVATANKLSDIRFEKMIDEVEDYAIILIDPDGVIMTWNNGAEKIKGYQEKDILGRSFKLFYTKEDKDKGLPDALLDSAKRNGKANYEGWRLRKDGTRFWGSITLTALHSQEGTVTGFLKVTRDLTEKKIIEDKYDNYIEELNLKNEELKKSEERYHRMISEVTDYGIILIDKEGKIIDWNKGAERLNGYTLNEVVGKSIRLFYVKEDRDAHFPEQFLSEAKERGSAAHERWRIRKDGTRFWASITITALHDEVGTLFGFSKVTKDLTDKKIAEDQLINQTEELKLRNEALRRSEERYSKMITEVQDYAILLLNKEGIIQNWNRGAALLKGYEASEIVGKSFRNFYLPEDQERNLPEKLLIEAAEKDKAISEGWRVRRDGSRFWGSVIITALHNDAQEIIGFLKVTRDLTERKAAEDAMQTAARELLEKNKVLETLNKELSSFVYVVSHDLKEPIRKIGIFSSRQREASNSVEQILEYSERIEESALRMQKLMEDLITYSEISIETSFEKIDLNEILVAVKNDLDIMINEKHAMIHSDHLPIIKGVNYQIQQVFQNLLLNALKFSKPNEDLVINIRTCEVLGSEIGSDKIENKTYHEICVQDNGIGFSQDNSKKIFKVFHRLKSKDQYSGSGIGLAIVKRVMDNHSGFVTAEGEEGKGASFKVYFPKD